MSSNMKRQARTYTAAVLFALMVASFATHTFLFFSYFYFSGKPHEPTPEFGLVHALENHGSRVYLTDFEFTGLTLLMIRGIAGLFLSVAIVPKEFLLPPPGTPTWITKISFRAKTDLDQAPMPVKLVFHHQPWILGQPNLSRDALASDANF